MKRAFVQLQLLFFTIVYFPYQPSYNESYVVWLVHGAATKLMEMSKESSSGSWMILPLDKRNLGIWHKLSLGKLRFQS